MFYVEMLLMADIARILKMSSENAAKTQKYKCLESEKEALRTLQTQLSNR